MDEPRPPMPTSPEPLREALTGVQFAHRHLLGDSDVSREDASASLVEVERTLRAALATAPPLDADDLDALIDAAREVVRFYGTDRTWSLTYRTLLGSRIDDLDLALAARLTEPVR